jgi:acylphosphatase
MDTKRVRVRISGEVQGVGFRANCEREANRLRVTGWVRNTWDGSVEAQFEGPAPAVDQMVQWCRHGPPAAQVTGVEVTEAPAGPPSTGFHLRSTGND